MVATISVPLVLALVAVLLARQGSLKGWLIRSLLMTSVGAALVVVAHALVAAVSIWVQRGMPSDLRSLASLVVLGIPGSALGLIFGTLLRGSIFDSGVTSRGARS
jgi:hypothetical protein